MEGDQLRLKRERLGMTQTELGKALDITLQSISRYERGEVAIPKIIELAMQSIERR